MRPLALIAAVAALAASPAAGAPGPEPKLNQHELAPRTCGKGTLVVDAVQKVLNDVDSGTERNVWALDDYTRHLKVWRLGAHKFCTIVSYEGRFETISGPSPGGTGTVPNGLIGRFDGGYRMDFNGTLRAHPLHRPRGMIGTFDYRCDASAKCPGSTYWITFYFTGVTGDDFDWWGWLYKSRKYGTWLNSIDGAKGDIVAPQHGKKKAT